MSIIEENQTITWIQIEPEWEWYYYVPLLDRNEWSGIEYDSVKYEWNELDYRFGVDYPAVPEPSTYALIAALLIGSYVLVNKFIKKGKK